jgi:signal transduction histidine kinase
MQSISCPHCNQPVDPQARYCGHCGVDLAMAAVLAERKVKLPEKLSTGLPMIPEVLVPRLGDYLVENGEITSSELTQALQYQKDKEAAGSSIMIGQALRELGFIDAETLDQAVTVQILQLHTALRQTNRQLEQRVQERTSELQRALTKLTDLNQLKANFIANISHELRTPLTHIKGYLDILADGGLGDLNSEQSNALTVIRRAETRLEKLIEDLIQFSLASRGELNLNISSVDLGEMIRISANQAMYKARAGEITLEIMVVESLPLVQCDEEKIIWVIAQLLDNAIKFTPKGGRVEIEAAHEDGFVTIAVTDTGIGIPAERLNEIFEPFHQLDGSSTRRYSGTGLGLALSSRIIEAHGTQVKVQSKEGKGSRFEFSLPVGNQ